MLSADHELPLEPFRAQPELALKLLRDVFDVKVRDDTRVRVDLGPENSNQLQPTEARCDATVIVGDPEAPDLAIVLECQLRPDPRKQYTWPVYLATLRARRECRTALLVLCPDAKTAAACAEPIETGHPGWVLRPLVLGPDGIAGVKDATEARRLPRLTVLGALMQIRRPLAEVELVALAEALKELRRMKDPDGLSEASMYYDYLMSRLSVANRRRLEEIMLIDKYELQSDFARGYAAMSLTDAIIAVLEERDLFVSDEARARITDCTDLDQLRAWVRRAVTVSSVEELFD